MSCGEVNCPPGSTLIDGLCQTITSEEISISPTVYGVVAGNFIQYTYGQFGARFYRDADTYNYPLRDSGTECALKQSNGAGSQLPFTVKSAVDGNIVWDDAVGANGRLNTAGVWTDAPNDAQGNQLPSGEWIGFSKCLDIPTSGKYCVGLAADNFMRFRLDGVTVARFLSGNSCSFNFWHVIEINLEAGLHIIELEGKNGSDFAAFAAEIYSTDADTLETVLTEAQLQPYIFWSTLEPRNDISAVFDIGEFSGYVCPDGTAYDSCTTGLCTSIDYEEPTTTTCFYRVVNCDDENDTYLVDFAVAETNPLYQNSVFELSGNQTFFADKCFTYTGLEEAESADVINVTVTVDHGINNCQACDPQAKVESCLEQGEFTYFQLAAGQPAMIPGNIYEFDVNEGCYKYIGEDTENTRQFEDVVITVDHSSQDCLICIPCQQFTNCETQEQITVLLDDWQNANENVPNGSNIVHLFSEDNDWVTGDPCWKYDGSIPCAGQQISFADIIITDVSPCTECESCNTHYMLTDCTDPNNTMEITWLQGEEPLDESQTHVFDFDEEKCWTAAFLPPLNSDCLQDVALIVPAWVACAYSLIETNDFVENGGNQAGNTWEYEMLSCIIDGVEYITGAPETWSLIYTQDGTAGLGQLPYNSDAFNLTNANGWTYNDQAVGMNAIFATLGVDDRVRAQTILQGGWAGMNIYGGIYIMRNTSFSITIFDNSGHVKILSDDGYCIDAAQSSGVSPAWDCADYDISGAPASTLAAYEYYRCTNAQEVPETFVVNITQSGPVVAEPPLTYE